MAGAAGYLASVLQASPHLTADQLLARPDTDAVLREALDEARSAAGEAVRQAWYATGALASSDETMFTSVSDAPEQPLTRLLDSASRRDFIYLVILLALFGRSNWFLVMAGIGAPIYFFLVLFAARPRGSLDGGGSRVAPGVNR